MTHLIVHGGRRCGAVIPSANKNAVLPMLCATLLTDEPIALRRVPDITDVRKILDFFRELGSESTMDSHTGTLDLHHATPCSTRGPPPAGRRCARRSCWCRPLLAPLRRGAARGRRQGLHARRARDRSARRGVPRASAREVERGAARSLSGAPAPARCATDHWLDYASVTTTENFVLCAAARRAARSR